MYTKDESITDKAPVLYQIVAVVAIVLNICLGLFPDVVLRILN